MFNIKIADLNIRINNKYQALERFCKDYIVNEDNVDFSIEASMDEINAEQTADYPLAYLESLAVYRKIAKQIIKYSGFLMHGVVFDFDGIGIAFLADSGTGKTTHMNLWKKLFGDKITVINGDKPLVRFMNDNFYAYGTPWAGKEKEQTNNKTLLKKICFIERSTENVCEPVLAKEAFGYMMSHIYMQDGKDIAVILDMFNKMAEKMDFYRVKCNMELDAAEVAYRGVML